MTAASPPADAPSGAAKTPRRVLFRNFGALTLGKVLGDGFTFLLFVAISRRFGQEGVGDYSFAIALTAFFAAFAEFGLYQLTVKELSRRRDETRRFLGTVLSLRLVLSVATFGVLLAAAAGLPSLQTRFAIVLMVGAFQLLNRFFDAFTAVFVAHEEMHRSGLLEFLLRTSTALAGIAVIWSGGDLLLALAMLPAANFLFCVVAYVMVRREYGPPNLTADPARLRPLAREAVPYALSSLLYPLTARTDVVVLGFLVSSAAAGVYNVGFRILYLLFFVPYFAGIALFPMASRLYMTDRPGMRNLYDTAVGAALLVGVPAVAGMWLIAPALIGLVFGPEFDESVPILRLLAPLLVLTTLETIVGPFLTAADRQAVRTRSEWIAALVNVGGNVALVPSFGIRGAAFAALASALVLIVQLLVALRPVLGLPQVGRELGVAAIGTAAFLAPLAIWERAPLALELVAAPVIYAGVCLLFPSVRAREGRLVASAYRSLVGARVGH